MPQDDNIPQSEPKSSGENVRLPKVGEVWRSRTGVVDVAIVAVAGGVVICASQMFGVERYTAQEFLSMFTPQGEAVDTPQHPSLDELAMTAMRGILGQYTNCSPPIPERVAERAYNIARAMLAEREKAGQA